MKRLVEFPSEGGQTIFVEVEGDWPGGETRRGLSPSAVVERAQTSFEDALDRARPMASSLVKKLRDIRAFGLPLLQKLTAGPYPWALLALPALVSGTTLIAVAVRLRRAQHGTLRT